MPATDQPLRIGVLGTARIAELAIVAPAAATGHRLVAVAARAQERARRFAEAHGVGRVHVTYDDLLRDREVEAVYNPLPNGLHGRWNLRALAAGKHVLSEKPSAANAVEARRVREAAERAGVVFLEGFHYPYHPLFRRVLELVGEGAVGEIQRVETFLGMPAPPTDDPRWSLDLAGGATMDLGCYALTAAALVGELAGGHPRVTGACAEVHPGLPDVDARLTADLLYPSGATGTAGSDMAHDGWSFHLTVTGSDGEIHVPDFPRPHEDDRLLLRRDGRELVERHGSRSSYTYQLEAFAGAVRRGDPVVTDAAFAVTAMELVDSAYEAAGLPPRHPTPD